MKIKARYFEEAVKELDEKEGIVSRWDEGGQILRAFEAFRLAETKQKQDSFWHKFLA